MVSRPIPGLQKLVDQARKSLTLRQREVAMLISQEFIDTAKEFGLDAIPISYLEMNITVLSEANKQEAEHPDE